MKHTVAPPLSITGVGIIYDDGRRETIKTDAKGEITYPSGAAIEVIYIERIMLSPRGRITVSLDQVRARPDRG